MAFRGRAWLVSSGSTRCSTPVTGFRSRSESRAADVLGTPGERSRVIGWDDVVTACPEIVIAMPCGWDAPRAAHEAEALGPVGGARALGVDGAAYFRRPGPPLVSGLELLPSPFHPHPT